MTKPFTEERKILLDISRFVSQDILPQIHEKFEALRDLQRDVVEDMEHNPYENSPYYHSLGKLYQDIERLISILRPIYESKTNNQLETYENQLQEQIDDNASGGRNEIKKEQTGTDNDTEGNTLLTKDTIQSLQVFAKEIGITEEKVNQFIKSSCEPHTIEDLLRLPDHLLTHEKYVSSVEEPLQTFIRKEIEPHGYEIVTLDTVVEILGAMVSHVKGQQEKGEMNEMQYAEKMETYEKIEECLIETRFGSVKVW